MEFPLSHQYHNKDVDEEEGENQFEGRRGAENTSEVELPEEAPAMREARDLNVSLLFPGFPASLTTNKL